VDAPAVVEDDHGDVVGPDPVGVHQRDAFGRVGRVDADRGVHELGWRASDRTIGEAGSPITARDSNPAHRIKGLWALSRNVRDGP
jgi:hypothetical protein